MICNPNNPCSGKYGKCLDFKLTNACNNKCPFCIEEGGFSPETILKPENFADVINKQDIETLLILGGEPLLYPDLVRLLSLIRQGIKIILTTNGSLLTPRKAEILSPYIKALNISIHHAQIEKHNELTKGKLDYIALQNSIKAFGPKKVRINCNLVKGYTDSEHSVNLMYALAGALGVKKIRFTELQHYPDLFVDARTIFAKAPNEPFEEGCENKIKHPDLDVTLRVTCGIVNSKKPCVKDPKNRNMVTKVLYSNGEVSDGWKKKNNKFGFIEHKKSVLTAHELEDLAEKQLASKPAELSDIEIPSEGVMSRYAVTPTEAPSPTYESFDSCHGPSSASGGCS
jgi:pyruvate-formate lyase-activating enzyme